MTEAGLTVGAEGAAPAKYVRALLNDRRFVFLLVGGFNVVQGFCWFAFFHSLWGDHVPYLLTLVVAYVPAVMIGFTLYRILVFKVQGHVVRDFARFTMVQAASLGINAGSLPFFHEVVGLPVLMAQAVSVTVVVVFNYLGHLYFSFRRGHGHPDAGHLVEPELIEAERDRIS
jgi:putative flippase GtrA